MRVDTVDTPPAQVEADAVAFALTEGDDLPATLSAFGGEVEARFRRLVSEGEVRGRKDEVTILHVGGEVAARRIVAAGLGKPEDVDGDAVRTAAANVARRLGAVGSRTLGWALDGGLAAAGEQARFVVDGAVLGPYERGRWRSEPEQPGGLERLGLCGRGAAGVAQAAQTAAVAARWTNRCRELVDAPANELTPEALAAVAQEIAEESPHLSFEALDAAGLERGGFRLFAAVARGSAVPPRLIVLRYEPPDAASEPVLGLVGKAITFDSGGLSLKPAASMEDMKSDMAGGGAVFAALGAVAELALPVRCIGVVAACENMPSGRALRPGDIVEGLSGVTVEVTNTDAEGRLVLADALVHARKLGATHLVDLATLTGGIVIAMGDVYAGLFATDDDLRERLRAAGTATGDLVWPWPLHRSYDRYIESPFADVKNSSLLRQGTPAYAARFLQRFAGEGPWAHVDMAGVGYLERGRGDYYASLGATGFGVRLLTELVRGLAG